ncbi:response regulator [Vibrio ziniensis]|uniref:Two-component system response regulator n=1 Tax=Vibrio ziniensis TaxID=2711221 RepID=A0A6G7CIL6_9VIBR|nr:two-component system response regulator [Vibrio ziniensis]QIH41924.1 two-component system response regulator [Vibrio ziniensis]
MYQSSSYTPTLLVIDDIPENLSLMYKLLKDDYKVKGANSGDKGLAIARNDKPDLILLDVMMPDMDGFEVCEYLKENPATKDIPIIFLTAKTESLDERRGLELGAVDYITKPIVPEIVKARVSTHVSMKIASDFLKGENESLEKEVQRRTRESIKQIEELHAIQDVAFNAMVSLAETRDNETGNHIRRTQLYIKLLAKRLSMNPSYSSQLNDNTINLLYKSAPLHDIGKIGIPDHILLKDGKLTTEEFEIMKTHTTIGFEAINKAEEINGKAMSFLRVAKEIAYSHHEKWDGSGYPQGLVGDSIPLSARLMAVVDVYDALISKRIYKPPFSHPEAINMIVNGRGTHFDPNIVDAFLDVTDEFNAIALRYA